MTYLDLVKRLVQELRIELSAKVTTVNPEPAASYGTTTELITSCSQWVQQAWIEIQEDQDNWNFMVTRTQFDLAEGQYSYDIADIVDTALDPVEYDRLVMFVAPGDYRYIWLNNGAVANPVPSRCYFVEPEHFFGFYDANRPAQGLPGTFSTDREGCLVFNTAPGNDDYNVEFNFKAQPQRLLADGDIPRGLHEKFHMLIVYRAMQFYSMGDEADKQYARATKLYKGWMNKLRLRELGGYSMPGTRS